MTKIKRSIPWLITLILISLVSFAIVFSLRTPKVEADSATSEATVGNVAPDNVTSAREDPASYVSSPTDVGESTIFKGTAADPNLDQWKLLVCNSDATTGVACTGTQWCVSGSAVDSGSENTCSRTALDADDYSNTWYAFACDASDCSANGQQGTGDSGTPFTVNHAPEFPSVGNDGPKDPGVTITITATANDDAKDTSGQVKLFVCKEQDFTGSACSGGGEWGTPSSYVNSDPTVSFAVPDPDGQYDYYPNVIDTWGMESDGAAHDVLAQFTVNNEDPVVSSVAFSNTPQSLTENTTTSVEATATVTDDNSCTNLASGDEIVSATAWFYRQGVTCNTGTADENNCYPDISCSLGSCAGGSLTVTCTADIWYNADPTDEGAYATNQGWNTNGWVVKVTAEDDDSATHTADNGTGTDFSTTTALDVPEAAISYGTLIPGESNTVDNNDDTTINTVGNCPINSNISGTTMTGPGTAIPIANQKYGLTDAAWGDLTYILSGTPAELDLASAKTTDHTSPATDSAYWGLLIPDPQASGAYSGTDTIAAEEEDTF